MSAIARMKATAGIDICHELAPKCGRMMKKLSLPQSLSYDQSPTGTIRVAFEEWLAGKSSLRPTWEEMMEVFREIKMIHLAGRIEKYFGTTSENGLLILYEINSVFAYNFISRAYPLKDAVCDSILYQITDRKNSRTIISPKILLYHVR